MGEKNSRGKKNYVGGRWFDRMYSHFITFIVGILGGAILARCADNRNYHYDDRIGTENVRFYETDGGWKNILEVTSCCDDVRTKYVDLNDDLQVDYVEIMGHDGWWWVPVSSKSSRESSDPEYLVEEQAQFDHYLARILEAKKTALKKGLEVLSGQ